MNTKLLIQGIALTTMLAGANLASAVTYELCTGVTTKTMPDSTIVTMWGYGGGVQGSPEVDTSPNCDSAKVPGPRIDIPPGDSVLEINLRNTLTEPTSIMIAGLSNATPPAPVFFTDGQGRQRARAMTHEAAANGGLETYNFVAAPGTYLYQSGSHPAKQVQMGLYGGLVKDAGVGEAYPGISYDNEVVLLYSEIDPALHSAVANTSYGTAAYPTTINYVPKYFLVNGAPYIAGSTTDISAGIIGQTTLIRFLNAGLESHVPLLHGGDMNLIAEYGSTYPFPRKQYSFELAAGQSRDALFTPDSADRYAIYDRRLRLTNNMDPQGGLMSFLSVSGGPATPLSVVLASPSGHLGANNMPSFSWFPQTGATNYKFWIKDPNGVVSQTWYTPAEVNCVGAQTLCVLPSASVLASGNYMWKVRAKNNAGLGSWSSLSRFSVGIVIPVVPTLDSPSGDLGTNFSPTFRWFAQVGTTNYKLWVKDPNGVVSQIWYTPADVGCDGTITPTTLCTIAAPSAPLATGRYTWKLRSRNSAGMSPWSSTLAFSVGVAPAAPTLNSPSGDLGLNNTPIFSWFAQESATNYKLWIKDPNGVVSQIWYSPMAAGCAGPITPATLCEITSAALINGNYKWKVRTRNSIGLGPWSSTLNFSINIP